MAQVGSTTLSPLLREWPGLFLSSLLLLATAVAAPTQETNIGSPSDTSAATLANNVAELRIFLTEDSGMVRGEMATARPSNVAELSLAIGEGTVTFRDDGAGPDRVKGDGVFSARFKFDTTAEFEALRAGLRATIDVLRDPDQDILIRRGPRDIVTAADAIRDAELKTPEILKKARLEAERAARLLDFKDPLRAAKALDINVATTPFQRLPGSRFDPLERKQFKVEYLFDFPIFTTFPPPAPRVAIDRDRSLLITAKDVVEDDELSFDACTGTGSPGGPWSFGHLMRELAHGTGLTPEEFTLHWLLSWRLPHEVNGWIVPARHQQLQHFIDGWRGLSPSGLLDVDYFPARLLAIVNRPDLAGRIGFGAGGSAGEGRLVFGLMTGSCTPASFTVIFEYGIAANSCIEVKAWQQRWKDLDQFDVGTDDYNEALESVTRAFTDHGSNPGQRPNTSSLSQMRTNENQLASGWDMREFRLEDTGLLDLVPVKQTPHNDFNGHETLRDYLGTNEVDILNDRHIVRERFPDDLDPFLGAVSNTLFPIYFWSAPDLNSLIDPVETRRKFSLATCNGCHAGETGTRFTHIGNEGRREMGQPAELSGFLRGETVTVPMSGSAMRRYEDLKERETAMSELLERSCFWLLAFQRSPFVH
ncbi:MAG: hypothetical protein E5V36_02140 [Mesorhizobium sp.]|nr:MAG: hypothetical protein E5V36_02140 [Mesorhizobium sp.]